MLSDLSLMADKLFFLADFYFNLYTGSILLSGVLILWLLRRVVRFFRAL